MIKDKIEKLKAIAPQLASVRRSSFESQLLFALLFERDRARDVTDLRRWRHMLANEGMPISQESLDLFRDAVLKGMAETTNEVRAGRPVYRVRIDYDTYITFFREMHASGAGKFIAGSEEHPPRFKWNYNLRHIALAAQRPNAVDNVVKLASRRGRTATTPLPETKRRGVIALFTQLDGASMRLEFPPSFSAEERKRLLEFIGSVPAQ